MKRLLVANRGEIACRIIRAAKALHMHTIAVYSEADTHALHVELADEAAFIGPAPARQSYLLADAVLQAGKKHGADCVHPGYGFLSENTDFALAADKAGIHWIGPDANTITQMGDKNRARDIAVACGVPILPGTERLNTDNTSNLLTRGQQVGYPLLVKAAGGGGGIGMRLVNNPDDLVNTILSTKEVAAKSFGDTGVYLERYVPKARHIEIQIFGFGDGTAVHLFERECSIQRRFQKIIEESPAPGLPATVLQKMADAAVALASYQRYAGPGTVEFLVDAHSFEFFFLEMNTRIQVEHGVTEMVTGLDLVQMQIQQAAGHLTPLSQAQIQRSGVAIECRIYAENPQRKFMPSPGVMTTCQFPAPHAGLRIDTGVRSGDRITPFYDPMIAKLIAYADTREQAISHLTQALTNTQIEGIHSNIPFLERVLTNDAFVHGAINTQFVDTHLTDLLAKGHPLATMG